MKRKVFLLFAFLIPLILNAFNNVSAQALEIGNVLFEGAIADVQGNKVIVSFSELGYDDSELISPLGSTRILFSIPAHWSLVAGGEIELQYNVFLGGANLEQITNPQKSYGGILVVNFNKQVVTSIPVDSTGSQIVRFTIPPTALKSARADGRHELEIVLNAQASCTYNIQTIVTIKAASTLELPFELSTPSLDLSKLPAPFYLRDSLIPDGARLVIPDQPEVGELQAALNVTAGFGSLVDDQFDFQIVKAGELSDDDRASKNLIFVGMPGKFNLLSNISFQTAIKNGKFADLPVASAEDGVVEISASPWNSSKVVLLVSGNSVDAVVKAAQAVSSGSIFVYENPTLAYVANIKLLSEALPIVEDFNFKELGYATETLSGIGVHSAEYLFHISREQLEAENGYLDLLYFHSGSLEYGGSSMDVELNGQIVASAVLSKESEQLTTLRVNVPPGFLRFGQNRLVVTAKTLPVFSCDTSGVAEPWLTILNTSVFHLPAVTGVDITSPLPVDLKFYPNLLLRQSDLADLAFILPRDNSLSLKIAGTLAYNLGRASGLPIANLSVAYADDVSQEIRNEHSLIIIGRASTLPLLLEFNDLLPAPFEFETDTANEDQLQIRYRIPSGVGVGYLELMASPFNSQEAVLIVSGNNDDGLGMAANALQDDALKSQLAGVFAVTNGSQVATSYLGSPFSIVGTVVPNAVSVVDAPISALPPVPEFERPAWLFVIVGISSLAIIFTLVFVIRSAFSKTKAQRKSSSSEDESK